MEKYRSPITVAYDNLVSDISSFTDRIILQAVTSYGIEVNKEELEKALKFDRNQYDIGFNQGFAEGLEAAEDLLYFCKEDFLKETFKDDQDLDLNKLIEKYGLAQIVAKWQKWEKDNVTE